MPKPKRPGNQHNSRHENGVVAPGKRIAKQKSNGHLNGSAEATAHSSALSIPSSSAARPTAQLPEKRTNGHVPTSRDGLQSTADLTTGTVGEFSEGLEALPNGVVDANGLPEHTHRKIDVNTAKNPMVHHDNLLHLALTILRSCPLGDTIAILLVLLWLPPTFLTVTNALFAVLTFMPPAGSFSSLPTTFHDIFQGSGGTPSIATIVLTDIIGLVLWLILWTPAQALAVELAQAVVATTLGGGNASKKTGSDTTIFCMSVVTINHVVRHDWIPERIFGFDWPAILSSIPYMSRGPSSLFSDDDYVPTRSPAGWLRVLVALHILIQGLVHVARRWYQRREYSQAISISKKTDAEAAIVPSNRPSIVPSTEGGLPSSAPDALAKGPATLSKETRDKISRTKKKRKQGTFVRSQQPLWAAFAATKVTILREYEQSNAQSEVAGAKATDTKNLGSAPFAVEESRVWMFDVQPDSFCFATSAFPTQRLGGEAPKASGNASVDQSKPFYVRINNTDWTSTKIAQRTSDEHADGQWTGEVFGLSPSSSYRCSFVQAEDGVVIHSVIVTTPPSVVAENESAMAAVELPHRAHRPSSPTTPTATLKKSLAAFETSLADSQARQKRNKKDSKAASTALRKEIDVFNSKISKLGGEDKAHVNRHLQWNQHTRQADDAVTSISGEIESLGSVPEDELNLAKEKKADWDEARILQTSTREDMFGTKKAAHQEMSSIQAEATTSQQKRERLLARDTKLNDQYGRLESATSHGFDEKERKNSEQAARDLERMQMEQRGSEQMSNYYRNYQESRYVIQQSVHQAQVVEAAFHEQQMLASLPDPADRPLTPEGDLPGTNPYNPHTPAFRLSAFGSPDTPSTGLRSHSGSLRHSELRPRSTSILSGNSSYADFEDQDPTPPMPSRAVEVIRQRGRKHSGGSGSGSSGSQRDPASPVVGNCAQLSPVGRKSPGWG